MKKTTKTTKVVLAHEGLGVNQIRNYHTMVTSNWSDATIVDYNYNEETMLKKLRGADVIVVSGHGRVVFEPGQKVLEYAKENNIPMYFKLLPTIWPRDCREWQEKNYPYATLGVPQLAKFTLDEMKHPSKEMFIFPGMTPSM